MEKYIEVTEYDGKEIVRFNLGKYVKDTFSYESEEIPSSVIIGRMAEHMADLYQRHSIQRGDLSSLAFFLRANYPEYIESLDSRGF